MKHGIGVRQAHAVYCAVTRASLPSRIYGVIRQATRLLRAMAVSLEPPDSTFYESHVSLAKVSFQNRRDPQI